ncbi:MAG TPA: hypothetical protein VIM73_07495 [Polyangiaceae bacterium]
MAPCQPLRHPARRDGCGAHPDLEQHEQMAEELEPVLREAIGW